MHPTRNAVWLGNRSQYVLSGADDGSLWVWDAATTQVVNIIKGGSSAIRKVQVSTQTAANSPQLTMPVFCTPVG
jgi:WD40 repeat protein